MMEKAKPLAYEALKEAQAATDKKSFEEWKKKGIVEIVYPPEELKKFAEVGAKPVWGLMGQGADRQGCSCAGTRQRGASRNREGEESAQQDVSVRAGTDVSVARVFRPCPVRNQ